MSPNSLAAFTKAFLDDRPGLIFRDQHRRLFIEQQPGKRDVRGNLTELTPEILRQRWRKVMIDGESRPWPKNGPLGKRPPAMTLLSHLRSLPAAQSPGEAGVTELDLLIWTPGLDEEGREIGKMGYIGNGAYLAKHPQSKKRVPVDMRALMPVRLLQPLAKQDGSHETLTRWLLSAMQPHRVRPGGAGLPLLLMEAPNELMATAVQLGEALGVLLERSEPDCMDFETFAAAISSQPLGHARVRLGRAGSPTDAVDELLASQAPSMARAARPDTLWILIASSDQELSDKALLQTVVVTVSEPAEKKPVKLAATRGRAIFQALIKKSRPIDGPPSYSVPFLGAPWAADCPRMYSKPDQNKMAELFPAGRWTGREADRNRLELFWLGSMNAGEQWAPGRWTRAAWEARLPASLVQAHSRSPEPEDVDRMRELLETHIDAEVVGVGGETYCITKSKDGATYAFHADPLAGAW